MASNTPRLGLYKKDPISDANDTFNIQTMLNDNWDKIDGKVAILGPDGKILSEQLPQQSLPSASTTQAGIVKLNDTLTSTSTTQAATANAVKQVNDAVVAHSADTAAHGIGDKSTLLTTNKNTIVEAINELFTSANNGKSSIAAVIGSPATSGDTFATLVNHIQNAKNTMATNLTNKGTSASGTESLQALANKIANVNTGKKYATGSGTTSGKGAFTVSGLAFTPSIIIVEFYLGFSYRIVYSNKYFTVMNSYAYYAGGTSNTDGWSVGPGTFTVTIQFAPNTAVLWWAYE